MPAAAANPGPMEYDEVVAVKKLIVGSQIPTRCSPRGALLPVRL